MNAEMEISEFPADAQCIFCKQNVIDELKLGKVYQDGDVITHYFCMLFSAEVQQNGRDNEGILGFLPNDIKKESHRADKVTCTYCRNFGATIHCSARGCRKKFHFPCGVDNGSLHQFFDNFRSFCVAHRKSQNVPAGKSVEKHICLICYEEVQGKPSLNTIWAPCCKTAWYHTTCVQRMAINGGYLFRCPKCNNEDIFRREMLECGIFIPDRDASWELEPHAYEELGKRHSVCDAKVCRCPDGRSSQSAGKWEILLCTYCGSQGTHYECSKTALNDVGKWSCCICSPVTNRSDAVFLPPVEEEPGPSSRLGSQRNYPPSRRRIGSDDDPVSSKRRAVSYSPDNSDTESTSFSHINSNGVERVNSVIPNVQEDSDENGSDVEFDVNSYLRFKNQPRILEQGNNTIIDLDSDEDVVLPSSNIDSNVSSDNNEVTSTSVDDNIVLDDDDDNDDVVFVGYDEMNPKLMDDVPQPTALLRFVEDNHVYVTSPAYFKRNGGIGNLTTSSNPSSAKDSSSSTETMWQPVPLDKSVIRSFVSSEVSDPRLTTRPLDSFVKTTIASRDSKKPTKVLDVICID